MRKIKMIMTKIMSTISGEVDVDRFWKHRNKIIARKSFLLLPWHYICYQKALSKSGAGIPITAHFENRPAFPHKLYGIFISAGARIGKDCVIFHQVTIGSNTLPSSNKKGSPVIGDNCYIGVGAKIIGNVKIGNNVRIGANCIVTEDVPDNCTVVLNKPRIIVKEHNDNPWVPFN